MACPYKNGYWLLGEISLNLSQCYMMCMPLNVFDVSVYAIFFIIEYIIPKLYFPDRLSFNRLEGKCHVICKLPLLNLSCFCICIAFIVQRPTHSIHLIYLKLRDTNKKRYPLLLGRKDHLSCAKHYSKNDSNY